MARTPKTMNNGPKTPKAGSRMAQTRMDLAGKAAEKVARNTKRTEVDKATGAMVYSSSAIDKKRKAEDAASKTRADYYGGNVNKLLAPLKAKPKTKPKVKASGKKK